MAEGGISDKSFGTAIEEYDIAAYALGFVALWESKVYPRMLAGLRPFYSVLRQVCGMPVRSAKHALIALANAGLNLIPFAGLRRFAFGLLGVTMGPHSSIGLGTRIYTTGNLSLGARSVVNRDCLLDNRGGIVIGENVSIARDVQVYTASHDVHSPFFELTKAPVEIGDHAVIFARCSIMPGVTIGQGAVIYPGAVVTRDIPAYALAAGVPAKVQGVRRSKPAYRLRYPFPTAM